MTICLNMKTFLTTGHVVILTCFPVERLTPSGSALLRKGGSYGELQSKSESKLESPQVSQDVPLCCPTDLGQTCQGIVGM